MCNAGDVLTPEQCQILQLYGHKLAVFRVKIVAVWKDGQITVLDDSEDKEDYDDADDDDDDLVDDDEEVPDEKMDD